MSIASRLKQARKSRGFTQESLAKAIDVSRGVIANIEYEKTIPQPLVIRAICDVLHISEDWLKTGNGEMDYNPDQEYSVRLLSEIYNLAQQLSPEEQDYILEMIKLFRKYKNTNEYDRPFPDIPDTLEECLEKYPPLDEDGSDANIG